MASEFLSNKYLLVHNISARPVVKLCEAPALGASLMMNLTTLLFLSGGWVSTEQAKHFEPQLWRVAQVLPSCLTTGSREQAANMHLGSGEL